MREDQQGREIFCKAQTPFRILTLSLWYLVPLDWPCFQGIGQGEENTAWHLSKIRRAASAMGANLLVIAGTTDISYVNTATGQVMSTVQGKGMSGYAIIDQGEQAGPIPSKGSSLP